MTLYLTGTMSGARPMLDAGLVGFLASPSGQDNVDPSWTWAADNGCFNARTYVGDDRWFQWLTDKAPMRARCLFATAPDVVGDHDATLARSLPWLPRIRALGYPAAFVAQNGATVDTVPWDDFDVLFIGGDTAWKLGPDAQSLAFYAKGVGKRVHMGRVNQQPSPPAVRVGDGLRHGRRDVPRVRPRRERATTPALGRRPHHHAPSPHLIGA